MAYLIFARVVLLLTIAATETIMGLAVWNQVDWRLLLLTILLAGIAPMAILLTMFPADAPKMRRRRRQVQA